MKRQLLLLTLLLTAGSSLHGQILAPELLCVSNDTLKWDNPINTCGLFNSYTIFGSLDINGSYDTIAVVTNQSANSFFHAGAAGRDWFYFMQSNFDCPGQTVLSSDTLDNKIPEGSPIQFVSVGNNGVEIQWLESPSPEVFAYIVYRQTPAGTTVIDTVAGGNTFTDLEANVEDQVETYFVNSLDRCGNTSLFTDPHSTILVNVTDINACEQTISLEWNLYQNWTGGIDRHEVWLSTNGGNFTSIATLEANVTSFVFEDANDMDTYCFFVRAYQSGTEFFSRSNVVCETPDLVQPVKEFALLSASVTDSDSVELTWVWDTRSEINTFSVNRSRDSFNLSPVTEAPPNLPLSNTNNFLDTNPVLIGQARYYQIQAIDLCDTLASTNIAATIALTADARPGGDNTLTWTPYYNSTGQIIDYEVFRIIDGKEELIASSLDATTFNDQVDISDPHPNLRLLLRRSQSQCHRSPRKHPHRKVSFQYRLRRTVRPGLRPQRFRSGRIQLRIPPRTPIRRPRTIHHDHLRPLGRYPLRNQLPGYWLGWKKPERTPYATRRLCLLYQIGTKRRKADGKERDRSVAQVRRKSIIFSSTQHHNKNSVIFAVRNNNGRVAEWLGRGLQNLVRRFESAPDLQKFEYAAILQCFMTSRR